MPKDDVHHWLAAYNRYIAEGRDRLAELKEKMLDRPDRASWVALLRICDRSLRLTIRSRAILIEQLLRWPHYGRR